MSDSELAPGHDEGCEHQRDADQGGDAGDHGGDAGGDEAPDLPDPGPVLHDEGEVGQVVTLAPVIGQLV